MPQAKERNKEEHNAVIPNYNRMTHYCFTCSIRPAKIIMIVA